MNDETTEKVAKAIANSDLVEWHECSEGSRDEYRANARAAVDAIERMNE